MILLRPHCGSLMARACLYLVALLSMCRIGRHERLHVMSAQALFIASTSTPLTLLLSRGLPRGNTSYFPVARVQAAVLEVDDKHLP